jgi:hypothetical protein
MKAESETRNYNTIYPNIHSPLLDLRHCQVPETQEMVSVSPRPQGAVTLPTL